MRPQEGFSLIELMLVVVIIGVLSAYGMTSFAKQIERDRLRKATENLKIIYNIQKRYNLEKGQYFSAKAATTGNCLTTALDRVAINTGLGTFIRDNDFSYTLRGVCTGTKTTGYSLVATRLTGRCAASTITLGQAGGEPTAVPVNGCLMW